MLNTSNSLFLPVSVQDHIRGRSHPLVTLVEYGDYECPSSKQAYLISRNLLKQLQSELNFVFRNFPLRQLHPHAECAAQAAEAAGAQGHFWEMHDLLFENQNALELEDLNRYAKTLGLDLEAFAQDLENRAFAKRVTEDFRSGIRSGVNSTPAFFMNETRYIGPIDHDSILEALQKEIDKELIRRAI